MLCSYRALESKRRTKYADVRTQSTQFLPEHLLVGRFIPISKLTAHY